MTLDAKIEALLYWKGESVAKKKLASILAVSEKEIEEALVILQTKLTDRGVTLVEKDDEVLLGTGPEASELIEKLRKEELVKDLGKAGLETLSIIAYKGPVSRAEIDYIRGVQSNFILRNLQIRGLVEKITNPSDQRSFLYKPTFEFIQYLGLNKLEDLPEYNEARAEFEGYRKTATDGPEQDKLGAVDEPSTVSGLGEDDLDTEIGEEDLPIEKEISAGEQTDNHESKF